MRPGIIALLSLLPGPLLGALLVGVGCSLPGVRHGSACSHNAALWLVNTIPLGVVAVAWVLLRRK